MQNKLITILNLNYITKILVTLWFVLFFHMTAAQNLLPLEWKISFDRTVFSSVSFDTGSWKDVNLLSSWERQGYFYQNGKCTLTNDFTVPEKYLANDFILTTGLQCDIKAIYINKKLIAENLSNQFWGDRNKTFSFPVSASLLKKGKNRIEIYASNLSYTGGVSHNSCVLTPKIINSKSRIEIEIPPANHIYTNDSKPLLIKYHALKNGRIDLMVKNDFHKTVFKKSYAVKAKDSLLQLNLAKEITVPGFYECFATLKDEGYTGTVQWMGISPEKIKCETDTITGFKKFWDKALKDLQQVKPEFKVHREEKLSTAKKDGYIVEMKSIGGITVMGYYFVPKNATKTAAVLHLPGYGYGFENQDDFLKNEDNVIELALCVRGHGMSKEQFDAEKHGPGIWGYKLYSEEENAYRGIYMDCVRAVEFLLSRPEVDTTRIGVMGGSQGGGLALATAGLCKGKIAACAYFDPFPSDIRDFVELRQVCKTEIQNFLKYYKNEYTIEQAMHVQDLLNVKGFAYWISCPVYFATALFDDDCPAHVGFAAYNNIKSPKQYTVYPGEGHMCDSRYNKDFMMYFKKIFAY
ncbi:acetylxylan esterase [Chryseobacterium sp. MIQD13]|uniref:acetylxylan esterase n=1 Tax=Chryseobacterium sp. MIQD13 TaxID=3422310 RepID=UPI003D29249A